MCWEVRKQHRMHEFRMTALDLDTGVDLGKFHAKPFSWPPTEDMGPRAYVLPSRMFSWLCCLRRLHWPPLCVHIAPNDLPTRQCWPRGLGHQLQPKVTTCGRNKAFPHTYMHTSVVFESVQVEMGVHLFSGARAWACTWTRVAHMCACEYLLHCTRMQVCARAYACLRACVIVGNCVACLYFGNGMLCLVCVCVCQPMAFAYGASVGLLSQSTCDTWEVGPMVFDVITNMYAYICICIYIERCICIYTHVCTPNTLIVHEHVYLTMYTCIYSYILIYIYAHIHTSTYT